MDEPKGLKPPNATFHVTKQDPILAVGLLNILQLATCGLTVRNNAEQWQPVGGG